MMQRRGQSGGNAKYSAHPFGRPVRCRRLRFCALAAVLLAALLLALPATAQEIGTVTLLEGALRVIRGTTVMTAAEGGRLRAGDILETSDSGFAQLEFRGDVMVALGPTTRVFVYRYSPGAAGGAFAVLSGWVKGRPGASGECRFATPVLELVTRNGTLVMHATPAAAESFVESGSAGVCEAARYGACRNPRAAKAGEFLSGNQGKGVAITTRPNAGFLESMPPAFRDTLPSRLSHIAGKTAPFKRVHEVSYAEIQPWLAVRQPWGMGFVTRFQKRLQDPAFRKGVEEHLREHPEWDAALHPEKHPSKADPASDGSNTTDSQRAGRHAQ